MNRITHVDTDAPSAELQAYWDSPEFKSYLIAKASWENAHNRYVAAVTSDKEAARIELLAAEDVAREQLAICRATPAHLAAFDW